MSLEAEIKSGGLDRGKVRYFPVVPGKLEFALELRRLLLASKPGVVAVELPGFLATMLSASAGAVAGDVGDSVSRRRWGRSRDLHSR